MSEELQQESAASAADEGEFEQAFAEFASGAEEPEQEPEQVAQPEQSESPAEQGEPEGEESELDKIRRELEETRRAAQDYEHRFRSEVGRQSAYQRQIQELKTQIQAAPKQTQAQQRQLSERMSGLMNDFPEIAEAVSEEISAAIKSTKEEIAAQLRPMHEREQQAIYESQEAAVKAAYPDFEEIASSTEFATWFAQQPESVRALAGSRVAQDAIAVIDYFTGGKRFKQPESNPQVQQVKAQRQAALQRNQSVRNTSPAPIAEGLDDYESAFAFYANKAKRR